MGRKRGGEESSTTDANAGVKLEKGKAGPIREDPLNMTKVGGKSNGEKIRQKVSDALV